MSITPDYSPETIVEALRLIKTGASKASIARDLDLSLDSLFTWQQQYWGLGLNKIAKLRAAAKQRSKPKPIYYHFDCVVCGRPVRVASAKIRISKQKKLCWRKRCLAFYQRQNQEEKWNSPKTIVSALKRLDRGERAVSICFDLDIGITTFKRWKSRYRGLTVPEVIEAQNKIIAKGTKKRLKSRGQKSRKPKVVSEKNTKSKKPSLKARAAKRIPARFLKKK